MRYKTIFFLFLTYLLTACTTINEEKKGESNLNTTDETSEMVRLLSNLADSSDFRNLYHWNSNWAEYHLKKSTQGAEQQRFNHWFEYCKQSLYSGNSQRCIDELEGYLRLSNVPFDALLNRQNRVMFEQLALAYLRLGEQENCQSNHNAFTCILPLHKKGEHQLRKGSEKAVELYRLLYNKFPSKLEYKWLLNLAQMTLGNYPDSLLNNEKITFPNWSMEQSEFPSFKEQAMKRGIAANGLSGGSILEDFNNDGFLDVFTTSYGMDDQVRLFINGGDGSYKDITNESGIIGIVSGLNCLQADYNNDGYTDILILRGGWLEKGGNHPNSLLRNNGDGTFSDVTKSTGLLSFHPTQTASWADVNKDGHLDLFIGNESMKDNPHNSELFINQGDGTFKEMSLEHGLKINSFVKGVVFGDINNDNWPDLYVSVLGGTNLLFKNNKGVFTEIGKKAKVQEPYFSFPAWFFDVNNDGFQDIFVSSYDVRYFENLAADYTRELQGMPPKGEKLKLYINNGDETFTEAAKKFGLDKCIYTMGCNYGDLDNDGWQDFYLGTGAPDFSTVVPNRMFRNKNGKYFEEVTSAGNFGHIQKGHGVAFGDIDNDGDQDIYAVLGGAYQGDTFMNVFYENPISKNNWITLDLKGTMTNRSAIGSRIILELENGRKIYRSVSCGGSFGASSLQQEIGIGKAELIKKLIIHWQKGDSLSLENITPNQKLTIEE